MESALYVFFLSVRGERSIGFGCGPYLHLDESQRVLPPGPAGPLHTVSVRGVASFQVLPVQVGRVTVAVPPSALVVRGTVVL